METPDKRLDRIYSFFNTNASDIEKRYKEKHSKSTFTKQTLYNIENGKTKNISAKNALIIKEIFPTVNYIWLTTGSGEMIESTRSFINSLSEINEPKKENTDTQDVLSTLDKIKSRKHLNKYDNIISVQAYLMPFSGRLSMIQSYYDTEKFPEILQKVSININASDKIPGGIYWLAQFTGQSMTNGDENNSIETGSWLKLIEIPKQMYNTMVKASIGELMGFFTTSGVFTVKKIKEFNEDTKDVILESLNNDKIDHPDERINLYNVYAVYKYLGKETI
ncbi:hypothetical protein CMT52_17890 [Elizabethkingia anophelis]|nr:hypothetical protein [Elizabethkingia anophelis]